MFRVEIEKADETIFYFGDDKVDGGVLFDTEESADEVAESVWGLYGYMDTYARFSVVDETGERLTDWEV
jgi:hypothetical protein